MIEEDFKGTFITNPSIIQYKLKNIKVFLFDWDGVFNDGRKDIDGHSGFSEIDAMGTNMMRFSYYLLHQQLPLSVILTGEHNKLAMSFAQRENFDTVYYKTSHKRIALEHLCAHYKIAAEEILFVFDDVLDFFVAKQAGVRCMIGRTVHTLLNQFAINNNLVDYVTKYDGGNCAMREISELIMSLQNNFNEAIENRMEFSEVYKNYLQLKKNIATEFFMTKDFKVTQGSF